MIVSSKPPAAGCIPRSNHCILVLICLALLACGCRTSHLGGLVTIKTLTPGPKPITTLHKQYGSPKHVAMANQRVPAKKAAPQTLPNNWDTATETALNQRPGNNKINTRQILVQQMMAKAYHPGSPPPSQVGCMPTLQDENDLERFFYICLYLSIFLAPVGFIGLILNTVSGFRITKALIADKADKTRINKAKTFTYLSLGTLIFIFVVLPIFLVILFFTAVYACGR